MDIQKMDIRKHVTARAGHRVRHPDGRLLDPEGEVVGWSLHWSLYLRDEAIDVADAQAPETLPVASDEGAASTFGKKGK